MKYWWKLWKGDYCRKKKIAPDFHVIQILARFDAAGVLDILVALVRTFLNYLSLAESLKSCDLYLSLFWADLGVQVVQQILDAAFETLSSPFLACVPQVLGLEFQDLQPG